MNAKHPETGCYYFPNYHRSEPRNAAVHGEGWCEWELVRAMTPRYPGHHQPKVPVLGYTDEDDPAVMAKKIEDASSHGIDYFIFDYYYYDDGPFLENCLNDGFLKAPNVDKLKFCFMWANHDWVDIHPSLRRSRPLLWPGKVTPETFRRLCRRTIDTYFKHPSYYCINGAPYFSIYHLECLLASFGSIEATAEALAEFRAMTKAAGFPDLHLNLVVWGHPVLPGEREIEDQPKVVKSLGFDSVTSYVWIHHMSLGKEPEFPYLKALELYLEHWGTMCRKYDLPYFPNVTMGWDPSPRTIISEKWFPSGYPYTPVLAGNTPENFETALRKIRDGLEKTGVGTFNINCWNEWTEGSMLEPEEKYGYGYLEAVKRVFGR
ncbi:MAG: hypothetical protein HPZ91_08610 [Lentisphaeria bacterium]|nr:hypothetical protein [Lentisphaeria bacterium]